MCVAKLLCLVFFQKSIDTLAVNLLLIEMCVTVEMNMTFHAISVSVLNSMVACKFAVNLNGLFLTHYIAPSEPLVRIGYKSPCVLLLTSWCMRFWNYCPLLCSVAT